MLFKIWTWAIFMRFLFGTFFPEAIWFDLDRPKDLLLFTKSFLKAWLALSFNIYLVEKQKNIKSNMKSRTFLTENGQKCFIKFLVKF